MNERRNCAQLHFFKEGAKQSEVREAPIEPAERKKDKNKKNPYLLLVRFVIRSDELPNRSFRRSDIGVWRWKFESLIVAYRPFLNFFFLVDWNARLLPDENFQHCK